MAHYYAVVEEHLETEHELAGGDFFVANLRCSSCQMHNWFDSRDPDKGRRHRNYMRRMDAVHKRYRRKCHKERAEAKEKAEEEASLVGQHRTSSLCKGCGAMREHVVVVDRSLGAPWVGYLACSGCKVAGRKVKTKEAQGFRWVKPGAVTRRQGVLV